MDSMNLQTLAELYAKVFLAAAEAVKGSNLDKIGSRLIEAQELAHRAVINVTTSARSLELYPGERLSDEQGI